MALDEAHRFHAGDLGRVDLAASQCGIALEVDAFGDAQTHQQIFRSLIDGNNRSVGDDAIAVAGHQFAPGFGVFLGDEGAAVVTSGQTAVSAGTAPCILAIAPVEQVVARLVAGACVVGNLVGRKSNFLSQFLRHVIEVGGAVIIGRHQRALGVQIEIGGAGLDGELIERHVALLLTQRNRQFLAPLRHALIGPGIDQIERHTRENAGGEAEGGECLGRGMLAAQRFQIIIVQRLHADRNAVDAGRAITPEILRFDGGRVGFKGDLDMRRDCPERGDRVEHMAHGPGRHQRGRAAAEKNAADNAARRLRGEPCEFGCQGSRKRQRIDRLMAHMAVEIAIGALGLAEGPMNIDAEGVLRKVHGPDLPVPWRGARYCFFRRHQARRRCAFHRRHRERTSGHSRGPSCHAAAM